MDSFLYKTVDESINLGADYAESRMQLSEKYGYTFKNGNLEPLAVSRERGISVRILFKGSLGFASTNVLDSDSVKNTAAEAVKLGKISNTRSWKMEFSEESSIKAKWSVPTQKSLSNISTEDKVSMLSEIDERIAGSELDVRLPYRFFKYQEEKVKSEYVNSEGTEIKSNLNRVGFEAFLTAHKPSYGSVQRMIFKGGTGGWEVVEGWNLTETVFKEAKILNKILLKSKKPPKGDIDLVLGSEVVGIICHESCGHPQEADRILGREAAQAGKSYLNHNSIGQQVGSEQVTIVDDPTIPGAYGYYLYDDEGVKTDERILIEKGVIENFLQNRQSAQQFNLHSNGSARSSAYDKEPLVRMANTYFKPGNYTFQELIQDIEQGVFIKTFMEWNIDDRRFNQKYVGLEAYIIDKGEITDLIRNPILEITTPGLFGSVDAVSKELRFEAAICGKGDPMQPIPVWHGGPNIRLRKIRLGG